MTGRVIAAGMIACLAVGARIESGQSRFEATDRSDITGVPGLRIINVRDNTLKTCYAVFVAELAAVDIADRIEHADIGRAGAVRDQRLGDLLLGFERERGSPFAGTPAPNPLRYQWEADSAQMDFVLTALNNAFARIEQELRRASRTAVTAVPQPCAASDRAAH